MCDMVKALQAQHLRSDAALRQIILTRREVPGQLSPWYAHWSDE